MVAHVGRDEEPCGVVVDHQRLHPGGAGHHSARRPSPWWSSWYITNDFLPRTNQVGAPWLGRSTTSGNATQMALTCANSSMVPQHCRFATPPRPSRLGGSPFRNPFAFASVLCLTGPTFPLEPVHQNHSRSTHGPEREGPIALYTRFAPIVGDKATSQMLSCFPTREADEPITKEFLRSELLAQRLDLARRSRQETTRSARRWWPETTHSREAMVAGDNALREAMVAGDNALHDEMHAGHTQLHDEMRTMFFWMMGTMITLTGVLSGVVVAAH